MAQPKRQWTVQRAWDPNETFAVRAADSTDAALQALNELGWGLIVPETNKSKLLAPKRRRKARKHP
jgi:hypothetical protein